MQYDHLDILAALTSLLRSIKEIDKLNAMPVSQWPTYASTLSKCTTTAGNTECQSQHLKRFDAAKSYYASHSSAYCTKVSECIKSRLAWTDLEVLRDIIFILASQGWHKIVEEKDDLGAIDRLAECFKIPLEKANVQIQEIHAEFECILLYATKYISLSTLDYRAVWWQLFHSPDASEWVNILSLIELLFSLPVSNGVVERVFSQMNIIKVKRRTLLCNDTLDDLLTISTANIALSDFSPNEPIDLWWKDKIRRPKQSARKKYKKRKKTVKDTTSSSTDVVTCDTDSESDSESDESTSNLLDYWDNWIDPQSETESQPQNSDEEIIHLDD